MVEHALVSVELNINGARVLVTAPPFATLADVLRDKLRWGR